jgi:type II secretory pathway pseudopilin PulG
MRHSLFVSSKRRGMIGMMAVLFLLILLGMISSTILLQATEKYRQGARMRAAMALEALGQSALERARAELRRAPGWTGAGPLALEPGEVEVRVERTADNAYRVRMRAAVPTLEKPTQTLERETLLSSTLERVAIQSIPGNAGVEQNKGQ